jgi:hypothetical protein
LHSVLFLAIQQAIRRYNKAPYRARYQSAKAPDRRR